MKVDIISGFLGAGKTTLIKKLLDTLVKDEKVAIVENEYGRKHRLILIMNESPETYN